MSVFNMGFAAKVSLLSVGLLALSGCGGEGEGGSGIHNAGIACAQCHDPQSAGFIGENALKTAGTIFLALDAADNSPEIADGFTIRIEEASGNKRTASAFSGEGGNGNFGFGALYVPSGDFTAVVLDPKGVEVNRSGIHTADRNDCNSCHTVDGTSLVVDTKNAPGRIVSSTAALNPGTGSSPATAVTVSFKQDVFPILNDVVSCNNANCHAIANPSALVKSLLVTTDDPAATLATIVNQGLASGGSANALLYTKGTRTVAHVGGVQLTGNNAVTVRNWIDQGALDN